MRKEIISKYLDCLFFWNDGWALHFYKNPNKRASVVYFPPKDEYVLEYYKENKLKFMTQEECDEIYRLQKILKKNFTYCEFELDKIKNRYKYELFIKE